MQNFDTLANTGTANWVNNQTLPGWYYALTNGNAPANYTAADGGPNQNVALSLGISGSIDRALGSQNASTAGSDIRFGLQLSNATGLTLGEFSLAYTGEQWRVIGEESSADKLTFEYQIFAPGTGSITAVSGWTAVTSLDFIAPIVGGGPSRNLDGTSAANSDQLSFTVSGFQWTSGYELWLRWTDHTINDMGANAQRAVLAVDDVVFSASVPEPSIASALLVGACLFMGRRRVRRVS